MDVHGRNGDQSSDHLGLSACEYSSTKYSREGWCLPVIRVRDFYTKVGMAFTRVLHVTFSKSTTWTVDGEVKLVIAFLRLESWGVRKKVDANHPSSHGLYP